MRLFILYVNCLCMHEISILLFHVKGDALKKEEMREKNTHLDVKLSVPYYDLHRTKSTI